MVNVYINHEKKFAFVEMRTVEEASNAMALDGIIFEAWTFIQSVDYAHACTCLWLSALMINISSSDVFLFYQGVSVRVRRPTDYNPSLAATLGPSQPNPNLNLAAAGLTPG